MQHKHITGIILAGGRSKRMGGHDKGLIELAGRPMVSYALARLQPQVNSIIISANRNLEQYRSFNLPVLEDELADFQGPLGGIASALSACKTEYALTVPCDSPLLAPDYAALMWAALESADSKACVAHDGHRMQPVFALLHRDLRTTILDYLAGGSRTTRSWLASLAPAIADLSGRPEQFININTPDEKRLMEQRLAQDL